MEHRGKEQDGRCCHRGRGKTRSYKTSKAMVRCWDSILSSFRRGSASNNVMLETYFSLLVYPVQLKLRVLGCELLEFSYLYNLSDHHYQKLSGISQMLMLIGIWRLKKVKGSCDL